ncbi:hypothetical protein HPB48_016180 [Haemaphysalis longicornis]|uniref:U3 small nucleolar ribonucleoprotein protein MPP10 n=1 Tax=Haemaphysalis longicornis TaxID=44386 RepID=A0A9J6G891_HAELO|nr:hypothetical protein HPB48_016180 [Haemaphysalis longicornis]
MAASTAEDSMGTVSDGLDPDQANMGKCLEAFESCTKKPEKFLEVQEDVAETMKSVTKDLYDALHKWESKTVPSPKTELPSLIVDSFDDEQIWQQLELRNGRLVKDLIASVSRVATKQGISLGLDLGEHETLQKAKVGASGEGEESGLSGSDAEEGSEDEDFDLSDASEEGQEFFDDERAVGEDDTEADKTKGAGPSSVVDDAFFRLADMEAFADQEEKAAARGGDSEDDEDDDIDYFGEVTSDEDEPEEKGGRDAKYRDFFDPPTSTPDPSGNEKLTDAKTSRGDMNKSAQPSSPETSAKSSFEKSQEFLQKKIRQMEEQNLEPRPWRLQGEVEASKRPENSLLQEHFQFEHATRQPIVITEETTKCLEDVILQRIRDKAWDDVERKTRQVEQPFELRRRVALEQEKSKLSLAQVYEQQFLEKQKVADEDAPPKEDPAHVEIRKAMRDLFTKLDALSNFHMMPKPVSAEVKVVSNLPSVSVEEVTPVGVSDASLLAPQEVKAKTKGELVAKGEKSRTQRLRERRLKKALQKRRAAKAAAKTNQLPVDTRKVIKATNTTLAKPAKGAKPVKGEKAAKGAKSAKV